MPAQGRVRKAPRRFTALCILTAGSFFALAAQAGTSDVGNTSSGAPSKAVAALDALFGGPHSGARAVHAKGLLCEGTFTPTAAASEISKAQHFAGDTIPVLVRFSNFSGKPQAPDNDPLASPRGIAIKFQLPGGGDTDIVAHSYDGFPVATPNEFVTFVKALGASDPAALPDFIATHPMARRFVEAPKPPPTSYGTETYFGVNAFAFTNGAGQVQYGRYRIVPLAGSSHLDPDDAGRKSADYLAQDLADRLRSGAISFGLDLQLAASGDSTTDGSIPWPAERAVVRLGVVTLKRLAADGDAVQRVVLFTPLNLVDGILPSDDPMLAARSRAYRISHLRRSGEASLAGGDVP